MKGKCFLRNITKRLDGDLISSKNGIINFFIKVRYNIRLKMTKGFRGNGR